MTLNKNILWVISGILVLLLCLQTCRLNKKIREGEAQITQLELDRQTQKEVINKQGRTINIQESIISNNTQALNNLTDSVFDLKKKDVKNRETIAYFKNVTKTQIKQVAVPYIDSVAMVKWADSIRANCQNVIDYYEENYIPVPREAQDSNSLYSIKATVEKDSLIINDLSIPDTLQLRFVEHKKGLFKPNTIEAQYFHSNPLVNDISTNSVYYKPKRKPFFQRVILPIVIGVGTGILISK